MIYEIRTYNLKPRSVPEFLRRTGEKIDARITYSQLGGFWYSEIGPLNQFVHIWPYQDLNQRATIRAQVVSEGIWPPDNNEFLIDMNTEIFNPASFMMPLGERKIGPIYEMRTYLYPSGAMSSVLHAWDKSIKQRQKLSPLAGCWYSEIGNLNKLVHLWAYSSLEERMSIRSEAVERGVWPPKSPILPVSQESKILLPADFSPMA